MQKPNGFGGRPVDVALLREVERTGPVSTRELAELLATRAASLAPRLRSLVKAGLVRVQWGATPAAARAYAVTEAGRRYLLNVSDRRQAGSGSREPTTPGARRR